MRRPALRMFVWVGIVSLVLAGVRVALAQPSVAAQPASVASDRAGLPALIESLRDTTVKVHTRELVVLGTESVETHIVPGQGSGVLLAPSGHVLTAAHVVQTADEIEVEFIDGVRVAARVHASEPAADVALLELERMPAGRRMASLGDSDALAVGDPLLLLGYPYGLPVTATSGRLAGRVRPAGPFGQFDGLELLSTDTCVLQGCSGGPLFDMQGRVVGMVTSLMTLQGMPSGLGFAASAAVVRKLVVERRSLWTGIGGYWLSGRLAHALNLPQRAGLLVMRIAANSPAAMLRLQAGTAPAAIGEHEFVLGGDVILEMQGVALSDPLGYQRASRALAGLEDGDMLRVTVLRGGQRIELKGLLQR